MPRRRRSGSPPPGRLPSSPLRALGPAARGTSASTSGCSGATTMKVAPKTVSGRVVKTSRASSPPSAVTTGKATRAPWERPIQLRCMGLTSRASRPASRSSASRSAYAVIRIIHWRQVAPEDGEVATLGATLVGDLLVGQHGAESGAPVHGRFGLVGQAEAVERLGLLGRVSSAQARPSSVATARRPTRTPRRAR